MGREGKEKERKEKDRGQKDIFSTHHHPEPLLFLNGQSKPPPLFTSPSLTLTYMGEGGERTEKEW